MRHVLNTLGPQLLVQLRVDPHVFRPHRFLRKLDDALHGPWCALLERAAVHALVEVDGVLAGDDVLEGGALALSCLCIGMVL